jgi:hypothetical protein
MTAAPFPYDAKWDKIRKSLALIGINADTATVLHGKARCPLREELVRLAWRYHTHKMMRRTPTARQFAGEIAASVKKIAAVRDLCAPYHTMVYLIGDKRAAEIHRLLTTVETELQDEAKSVLTSTYENVVRHEGKHRNARKSVLRDYLLELAKVWHELAGASGAPRHRNQFVLAAAALATIDVSIKNVRDFLSSKKTKTTI